MQCEVEVVSWRERRIRGSVLVAADADIVWGVLTDYERLADFIPNLFCRSIVFFLVLPASCLGRLFSLPLLVEFSVLHIIPDDPLLTDSFPQV